MPRCSAALNIRRGVAPPRPWTQCQAGTVTVVWFPLDVLSQLLAPKSLLPATLPCSGAVARVVIDVVLVWVSICRPHWWSHVVVAMMWLLYGFPFADPTGGLMLSL